MFKTQRVHPARCYQEMVKEDSDINLVESIILSGKRQLYFPNGKGLVTVVPGCILITMETIRLDGLVSANGGITSLNLERCKQVGLKLTIHGTTSPDQGRCKQAGFMLMDIGTILMTPVDFSILNGS